MGNQEVMVSNHLQKCFSKYFFKTYVIFSNIMYNFQEGSRFKLSWRKIDPGNFDFFNQLTKKHEKQKFFTYFQADPQL